MADSPLINSEGSINIKIYSDGAIVDDNYRIISMEISKRINRIPYAKIFFSDGDMPEGDFPLSNEDVFKPGKEITIEAGYNTEVAQIFKGIVIKHGIRISGDNSSQLVVELKDKAMKMTVGKTNANYTDSKDSDVISSLINNYDGLNADIDTTDTEHKQLIQYYTNDWDFMLSRAEANGLLVIVDDCKVYVNAPKTDGPAVLKVNYGEDLKSFKADVDTTDQLQGATSYAWSIPDLSVTQEEGEPQNLNTQGDLSDSDLSDVLGLKSLPVQSPAPLQSSCLQSLANAALLKGGLSKIKGRMVFQGSALAKPGTIIELDRVGKRFNGNVYINSVLHDFSNGNWTTEASFGMGSEFFQDKKTLSTISNSGYLSGISGLQIAIVEKLEGDPDNEFRIQVKCPMLGGDAEAVWARLSNLYCLNEIGSFFIPEIGSEVIIGFFDNDPRHPVVLGSMYSSKNTAPYQLSAENNKKALITKSKLKIEFDDDKKITTIDTPGGNKIVVSDEDKSILLNDQNNNKVELGSNGITIKSAKDIKISASGKISMDGTGGIELNSNSDIKLSGLNINQTANASFTAKGTASAEVSASGNTTIKGALVMIN